MTRRKGPIGRRDFGLEAVSYIRKRLQVDAEWACARDRGYRWWPGPLAQDVWAEPLFDDNDMPVTRVHIRTDLARGFNAGSKPQTGLLALMTYATVDGPVRNGADGSRLGLASCVWLNESNMGWAPKIAAWAAAIQAAEAHILLPHLPDTLGMEPDASEHPTSGPRDDMDEMLGIVAQLVRPQGKRGSAYEGKEMSTVLSHMVSPPCLMANGDAQGLAAEFPFSGGTSLLRLSTDEENPRVGHGLLSRLSVPDGDNSVIGALEMNERELRCPTSSAPRSHFLGSWTPDPMALTFASFMPNVVHEPGVMLNLTLAMIARAKWAAEDVFGDDWETSFPVALEGMKRRYGR